MTHVFVDNIRQYQDMLMSTQIFVVDVETTLISKDKHKTVYNTPPRYICHGVMPVYGFKHREAEISYRYMELDSLFRVTDFNLFVGHNITYDIFIASQYDPKSFKTKGFIWDTMLAEYLLTDQIERMPSLEKCCENYGIAMRKDEEVAQAMKAGICPSTLPQVQLEEYLKGDLEMTKQVFLKQKAEFHKRPEQWQVMFINQMFFLVNTLRASVNGMKINKNFVENNKRSLTHKSAFLEGWLTGFMGSRTATNPDIWNPASNTDLTVFLYGGVKKWDERVANGVYKTGVKAGQTKYKVEKKEITVDTQFIDRGSVDESSLQDCLGSCICTEYEEFLTKLIEYKDVNKNLNTYFEGYMNHATVDDFIKPKYNHGLTPTGRLTCSGPNLQNIKG